MKTIPLKNSTTVVAVVDDEDYELVKDYRWLLSPKGYIIRYYGPSNDRHQIRLHNQVLGLAPNSGVDHINGCKWDNTRVNLRQVSRSVNAQNKLPSSRSSTGFKGVAFDSTRYGKQYKATICKDGKNKTLGYFLTPEEAATAYDKAAIELYGEAALTNAKIRNEVSH